MVGGGASGGCHVSHESGPEPGVALPVRGRRGIPAATCMKELAWGQKSPRGSRFGCFKPTWLLNSCHTGYQPNSILRVIAMEDELKFIPPLAAASEGDQDVELITVVCSGIIPTPDGEGVAALTPSRCGKWVKYRELKTAPLSSMNTKSRSGSRDLALTINNTALVKRQSNSGGTTLGGYIGKRP